MRNWMRAFSLVLCMIPLDYLLGYDFNTSALGCQGMSDLWCDLSSFTQPKDDVLNVGFQVGSGPTDLHSVNRIYYISWWDSKEIFWRMLVAKWFQVPLTCIVWTKNTMEVNGNQKGDILKNVGNQMVSGPIDFHSMDKKYNGSQCHMKKKYFRGCW